MLSDLYSLLTTLSVPVYPCVLPPETDYPAIAFEHISSAPEHLLNGTPTTTTARVQIDIYSDDHAEVDSVSNAVRGLLDGYRGTVGICWLDNELENPETYEDGSGRWIYTRTQDYFVKHS